MLNLECDHMGSPVCFGAVRVANRFSFQCCVVMFVYFVCLRPVSNVVF